MWYIFAVLSSFAWGLDYLLQEKVLQKISVTTFYAIQLTIAALIAIIFALLKRNLYSDFKVISTSKELPIIIFFEIILFTIASFLLASAIQSKNAALASIIEITYPIFIVLWGYFLFDSIPATIPTIIGALFIFFGISLVVYFNT